MHRQVICRTTFNEQRPGTTRKLSASSHFLHNIDGKNGDVTFSEAREETQPFARPEEKRSTGNP